MLELNTHLNIDRSLCGKVIKLENGYAEVLLHTTQQMKADTQGLVHGGFIFGAADYTAMCAVNDPYVVLGSSTSRFLAPVKVGDTILCKATMKMEANKGKKRMVDVVATVKDRIVFEGSFSTFVLDRHVLN